MSVSKVKGTDKLNRTRPVLPLPHQILLILPCLLISMCLCRYAMTSITVPEPVMSLAIAPKSREASGAFSKALNRFTKEDPTFKVGMDAESGQTIISGMGELHLDIYVERMKREYKVWLSCW